MKTFLRIVTVLALALVMYVAGWWVLIERGQLNRWLGYNDPFAPASVRTKILDAVARFFDPIDDRHYEWTTTRLLRKVLIGRWEATDDDVAFVEISPDGVCVFRFGITEGTSMGEIDLSQNGYVTEFNHEGEHWTLIVRLNRYAWGVAQAYITNSESDFHRDGGHYSLKRVSPAP